jgi:MarR family transcriptional regulator, negative regulator of the multidrug operon emrRAB
MPTLGAVGKSKQLRLTNVLGAAATGLTDAMQQSMVATANLDAASSAALVAMLDFTPGGTIRALSQVLGLTHSGAVRLVDRLVAAGYVERAAGVDARSRRLRLTRSGRAVARRVRAARKNALEPAVRELTPAEQDALTALSERLVATLTERRLEARAQGRSPAGGALCRVCDFTACGRAEGRCPAATTAADAGG